MVVSESPNHAPNVDSNPVRLGDIGRRGAGAGSRQKLHR